MKVVLVCIAKDEDHYIEEWIDYQYKLGFDKVIMYENDWRCSVEREYLEKIPWDGGNGLQMSAYTHFIKNNIEYDYATFIDCDEFITLKKHKNIKEFIQEYEFVQLSMNWYIFGPNGKLKRDSKSQLTEFKYRNHDRFNTKHSHVKLILNLKELPSHFSFRDPHHTTIPSIDTNGKMFNGSLNHNGPRDVIYISHMSFRTYEDYVDKYNKGCVFRNEKPIARISINEWKTFLESGECSEVFDDTAYKFMYENED